MRQGGSTANGNVGGKAMEHKQRCSACGRSYAMEWAKNNHERLCKEYNEARK